MSETPEPASEDALRTVVDAGATLVTQALDRVLGGVRLVRAGVMTYSEVTPPGEEVAGSAFDLSGALVGTMVHLSEDHTARHLAARLLGHEEAGAGAYDSRDRGALSEIGNIAASAFLNAVADHLGRACLPSVPRFLHGQAADVLQRSLRGADGRAPGPQTRVLVVEAEASDGRLLLVTAPTSESLALLGDKKRRR
jgi:chemotaxis protein CheY-P-specific phosphatase CheC